MKTEINIAKILKDKPQGIKLYSLISGEVTLDKIYKELDANFIFVKDKYGDIVSFESNGKYNVNGECVLFPSKEMRDWHNFTWKKGDVLVSNDGDTEIIFDKWYDDTYTNFYGKHYLNSEDENNIKYKEAFLCTTERYSLENRDSAQTYINTIEERLDGKLNLETLEIEQPNPEFKDGDIITIEDTEYKAIIIYKSNGECMFRSYAVIDNCYKKLGIDKIVNALGRCTRLATNYEKQQLFSALEKECKRWNPDTKQIEDLPKKCEFKPMDWCLMKYKGHYNNRGWELCQYAYTEHRASIYYKRDFYHAVGGEIYAECIPYNDQTKHLLGTTDEWKGGEQ